MEQNTQNSNSGFEQALKKHLLKSQMPGFDNYLYDKLLNRLSYEKELRALKPKLVVAFGVFLSGLTLLVFTFIFSLRGFAQTQTFHYLSLTFTDFKIILTNWQDYSLGILENLPLGSSVLLLSGILGSVILADFAQNRFSNFRKTLSALRYGAHHKLI